MKRIYNLQTVLPQILIGLLLIFVAYMGSAQIPESIGTSANDIGKSYTAGTRIITGLPKYFPDTVKNETLFAMDKNNNRLFTWNPKSSRWEVDKIRGNSSSTPRMEVLNSLVFDYTNTILQDSNNFKYYRWDLTANIWNTGLNGSDTLTNYKVFTPTIANVLGYKEIYSGATLPASATIFQTGNKFLLTPDGTEYTYQGNHIWFSNIVKGTATPLQTVTSGTETFDNSRAVWKNPNISVVSGQTVDYSYQNTTWKPLKGFLNIEDFGANVNNIDNSAAINAAINYLNSLGGGDAYIPEGTYIVKSSLFLQSNVNILGKNSSSIIKCNADSIKVFNSQITGVNNVAIKNLTITAFAQTADIFTGVKATIGIYFTNSKNITIDNVKCTKLGVINLTTPTTDNGYGGYGFFVESRYGVCENILINNCIAEYIAGGGIYSGDGFAINAFNSDLTISGYNIKVTNCFSQFCGRHCYSVAGGAGQSLSNNVLFQNCRSKESAISGLDIEDGKFITIDNCYFDKCGNSSYYYDPIATYGYNYRLLSGVALGNSSININCTNNSFTNSHYGLTFGAVDSLNVENCVFDKNNNGDLIQRLATGFIHSFVKNNDFKSDTSFWGFYNSALNNNSLIFKNQFRGFVGLVQGNNIDFENNSFSKGFRFIGSGSNNLRFNFNKFLDYAGNAVYNPSNTALTLTNGIFEGNEFIGTGNLTNGFDGSYHTYQNLTIKNNYFNGLNGAVFNSTNGDGFENLKEFSGNTINSCANGLVFVQGTKNGIIQNNIVSNLTGYFINISSIGSLSYVDNLNITGNVLKNSVANGINFAASTGYFRNCVISNNNFSGVTGNKLTYNSTIDLTNIINDNVGLIPTNIITAAATSSNFYKVYRFQNSSSIIFTLRDGDKFSNNSFSIVSEGAGNVVLTPISGNINGATTLTINNTKGSIITDGTDWFFIESFTNANSWSLLGNTGTTAGTNFLGTTDAQDLVFKTSNTEKLRVLSGGNVGIGTTLPAYKLDVNASSNPLRLQGLQTGATTDLIVTSASGVLRTQTASQVVQTGSTLNVANSDSIQFNNTAGANLFNIIRKENPTINVGTAVTGAPYVVYGNPVYPRDNSALLIGRNLTGSGLFAHAIRDETIITPTTSTSSAYASFDGIATFNGGGNHHNHFRTFQSRLFYNGGTGGVIDALNSFTSNPNITSGTASLMHHIEIVDATGSGSVGEQVGLYIPQLSKGTSNYSIYSAGTQPSYHGGIWQTGSDILAAGSILAKNFYSVAGAVTVALGEGKPPYNPNSLVYYSTLIGVNSGQAMHDTTFVRNNTFVGANTGYSTIKGSYNTFTGSYSGYSNTTGTNNIYLGNSSGMWTTSSNKLIIDSYDRTSSYGDSTLALINGTIDANVSNQKLRINAATITLPYLPTGASTDLIVTSAAGVLRTQTTAQVVQNGITKTSVTSTFTVPSLGEYLIPFTLTGTTQASIVAATYIATDVTGCSFSIPFLAGDGTGTVKVINRTASAVTFTGLKVNFAVLSY